MEAWYVPLSILPGVGLLIMSTAHLQSAMSAEINELININCTRYRQIVEMKIEQLDRLNKALVALYVGAASIIVSTLFYGLTNITENSKSILVEVILLLGALSVLVALAFLMIFSFKAVKIKKDKLLIGLEQGEV